MHFLFRVIPVLLLLWLICYYFYSLGRKNALKGNKKKPHNKYHSKKVESTVVEKEQDLELNTVRKETVEFCHEGNSATFPSIQMAARILFKLNGYHEYLNSNGQSLI